MQWHLAYMHTSLVYRQTLVFGIAVVAVGRVDLEASLKANGGFVHIRNFLPDAVASSVTSLMAGMPNEYVRALAGRHSL